MVASKNCQVLDLVAAGAAAVCAIIANQRPIPQKQQVRVRVEEGSAGVASKAIKMPSVASCVVVRSFATEEKYWKDSLISHIEILQMQTGELKGEVDTRQERE